MDEDRKQKILDHTDGMGVDVAIVATSSMNALEDAIGMVRKGGTVMMFGVPSKGAKLDLDMSKIYSKEITLVTSYAASDKDTKDALDLIESSQIDVKQLITHTYRIVDSQKAFDHARSGDNEMKIIIVAAIDKTFFRLLIKLIWLFPILSEVITFKLSLNAMISSSEIASSILFLKYNSFLISASSCNNFSNFLISPTDISCNKYFSIKSNIFSITPIIIRITFNVPN